MPGLVPFIPAIVAGAASLVGTNAQQKSAAKNNENQQNGQIQNAANQASTAANNYNAYANAHPNPFSAATVRAPQAGGYSGNPAHNAYVQRILQSAVGTPQPGGPVPPVPPPQMTAFQQQQQQTPTSLVNAIIGS